MNECVYARVCSLLCGWTRTDRPGTSDFIAQQLQAMTSMQAEREAQEQEAARRKAARPRQGMHPSVPAIPPVPPLPPKTPA